MMILRIYLTLFALVMFHGTAFAQAWWSGSYSDRQTISITTGSNTPDKGYDGYTARLNGLDSAGLIAAGVMRPDCNDLRVIYWNGTTNTELPRHVLQCNSANTDVRFKMVVNQAASTTSNSYFLYYGNPSATAPAALSTTNVYLWYDDGSANRFAQYQYGRFDNWAGVGYYAGTSYNAAGYYQYSTGDNFTFGMRRAVDERDVYVEVETYHQRCFPVNIVVGPIVRGIVNGSGGGETSNHYFTGNRAHQNGAGCSAAGYNWDGDIGDGHYNILAVNGVNPPVIVSNQWRRMGLAAWRTSPTRLSFYDEDNTNSWDALGYPSVANRHVTGTDASGSEGRGSAGYVATQDQGRFRNMLIRRYTEPEPMLVLIPDGKLSVLVDSEVYDPSSLGLFAIPENDVLYTVVVSNTGSASIDSDSIFVASALPGSGEFYNGDVDDGGPESNPVSFSQSVGAGLTFSYATDIRYSSSMAAPSSYAACSYSPSAGYDSAVTYICVNPKGSLSPGSPDPQFTITFRVKIE